jgi:DNA-binding HxlR family transcriptional regulator
MTRKRFEASHCSVARALNEVGERWSLRIVLEAMYGTRRFVDFQRNLGIARNILCDRLDRLVEHGVLRKVDVGEHGCRYEYRLTDKGRDLFTVVEALRQWGERWTAGEPPAAALCDRASGRPVAPLQVRDADGRPLTVRDVVWLEPDDAAPAEPPAAGHED